MKLNEIKTFLEPEWTRYQHLFAGAIASPYSLLTEINDHLVIHQGKQIRPVLSLLSAKMYGRPPGLSAVAAAVVEMVHTATLLHDDVADQSDTRRGAITVQKLFSPAASVLLGDFWLARAFQLLMDHQGEVLLANFARAIREMSEGELFQIEKADQRNTTIEEYYQIITKKTALLIASGMVSGAQSAGASAEQCALVEQIGLCLGMAFQIRDDIFDYSPHLQTGKPSGQDLLEGKMTLPLLGALEQASETESHKVRRWIRDLDSEPALLSGILDFVTRQHGVEFAQQVIEEKEKEAQTLLLQCPDNPARQYLGETIHYLSVRGV